ncbi:MAG: OmpH family outer membrane protein [Gammaproteobacteria bacterium]|nr:OmpH family outer membrane protein [Gammaproteobacteria bacterium]
MKVKRNLFVVAMLLTLASHVAFAEIEVAVVNATKAMFETEDAKAAFSDIEKDLLPEQQELQDLQNEIKALNERFTKDASVMSAAEARDLQKEIEDKSDEFQYRGQRWEKDLQERQTKVLENLTPKFNAVLEDIVELEGYDFVLNADQRLFLYVNPKHDITRRVTEKLNNLDQE